jgi:fatty-acyl-CoA synthase
LREGVRREIEFSMSSPGDRFEAPHLAKIAANYTALTPLGFLPRAAAVYLKKPAATETAFAQGWFHTGDLAVRHPDGYVEIKDRSKGIIISGGENISSIEVEDALYSHPQVMEAAVVAKPDPRWGEPPSAFVTVRPDSPVSAEDIMAWCRTNLAHYKVPRTVVFGPLPKTTTGKIQKFELRERAKELRL